MDNYGTDFKGTVKIESVPTKPAWTSDDERRIIYCEDTGQTWRGGASDWEDQGAQGNQGDQGAVGEAGAQGNQGGAGPQGNQGGAGDPGAPGNQGDTGAAGPQGNQGNTGSTGSAGPQGNQGGAGPQGNQGNQGNQGAGGSVAGNNGNVQFNNSGSLGGSDSLQWDNSNKRLGVGLSPSVKLHVQGDNVIVQSVATNADAHSLPELVLFCRDQATENGAGGFLRFQTYNSAHEAINGIQLNGGLEDATDGSEQGCLDVAMYRDGAVKLIAFSPVLDGFVPGDNNYWNLGGNSNNWATVYAIAYVDNTPAFNGDAIEAIKKIKSRGDEIDHETLPTTVQRREKKPIFEERVVKYFHVKHEKKRKLVQTEKILEKDGKRSLVLVNEIKDIDEPIIENVYVNNEDGSPIFDETGARVMKQVLVTEERSYTKKIKVGESDDDFVGRDLGAMISVLTKGMQQIIERIDALEKKR